MAAQSDFEPITHSAPLVRSLRERIERAGPITFRDFMEAALYDPDHGYYATTRRAPTRDGDFLTSPEVHPVFGALVGRTLAELWELLGNAAAFDVIEQGAGTGALARDILAWAGARRPEFARALRYALVERSAVMRAAQRDALAAAPEGAVRWLDAIPAGTTGVVLSNEFLDALPVHRVMRRGTALSEVFVGLDDAGRFVDVCAPPSTPALDAYFAEDGVVPGEGCLAEVNLDAVAWMRETAAALGRGYVLTFDYGYDAPDLYAPWRRDGTLLCFSGHSASSDPYQRVGKQDITASVDFTAMTRAGEEAGLRTLARTDQASFLVRLGIGEGIAEAAGDMEEYFARRRVVTELIDPARLGRITVLLQGKGVPGAVPQGFRD